MAKFRGKVQLLCKVTVDLDATELKAAEAQLAELISIGCDIGLEALCEEGPATYSVIWQKVEKVKVSP